MELERIVRTGIRDAKHRRQKNTLILRKPTVKWAKEARGGRGKKANDVRDMDHIRSSIPRLASMHSRPGDDSIKLSVARPDFR